MNELRIQALIRNVVVMRGQAVEGGSVPFQLWRNIVRRLLLVVDATDQQAAILKDLVPDVSQLLDRNIPNAPELTGPAYQDRLILTVVDLLRDLPQPIVLLLEDLQWALESLDPLRQILKVRDQLTKLMIVANYRDDEAPKLAEVFSDMVHIKLARLDPAMVGRLSTAMLGDVGAQESVIQLLHQESEGNVFFVVETVRALAEESGGLHLVGQATLTNKVLTSGMQQILLRRLNSVDSKFRQIQELAAIWGRTIDTKLLSHAHDEETVHAWIISAAENAVLEIQDNVWRFAHDKLRETVIMHIPKEERTFLHRTIALATETIYPNDTDYNTVLLEHWRAAENLDKELTYLDAVSSHMINIQGAYAGAQQLLENALERLPAEDYRCVAILNGLSTAYERVGQYAQATEYAEQARRLAEQLDDKTGLMQSLYLLGTVAWKQGAYDHAMVLQHQSLEMCQHLGDQRGIADRLHSLGIIAMLRGDYNQAALLQQESLTILQSLGDQRAIATNLNGQAIIAWRQGDFDRSTALLQQNLTINRQLGDQRGIAGSLNNLGVIAEAQGDLERATTLYEESLTIKRQLGDQPGIANTLNNLGVISRARADQERAIVLFRQSLAIMQQLGDQEGIAESLFNLGNLALDQAELNLAKDLLQQSLIISQSIGDRRGECKALLYLGWVTLKQGEAEAVSYFVHSLAIANEIAVPFLKVLIVIGFAGVFRQQRKLVEAAELLGLAQYHRDPQTEAPRQLKELTSQLETALAPEDLQAASERGKKRDLEIVVADLLERFTPESNLKLPTTAYRLDAILTSALAKLNAGVVDKAPMSLQTAYAKLTSRQLAEIQARIQMKMASTDIDATVDLQDVVGEVVALLRAAGAD
ncbi:tetratricopeptide repeat protein [bacterium]|nr:tetratricopeptide repeat protein [bacterium]